MIVKIEIAKEYDPAYAVIYTTAVTEEIQKVSDFLQQGSGPVTGYSEDRLVILQPEEIYMVRVEDEMTAIYSKENRYISRKRLKEIYAQVGDRFLQISKSTIINLRYLDSMEAGFGGTMLLKLKNGCKDYVSRFYLKALKQYLGL
ncbi:MAG: LytTR family transcriptional regulator [Parasporobacterium sp.]|nr:LytTR family transcriptional regulator [Parasporobacterium sp.]